jgi:hypothetical protein
MLTSFVAAALQLSLLSPTVCSVRELRESPDRGYPLARVEEFVDSAELVVRAVVVGAEEIPDPPAGGFGPMKRIVFSVAEHLRGDGPDTLRIPGWIVETDDFNPLPVPYRMVRPAGQRGSCDAREYRLGAEYLLLLRSSPVGPSPHWRPLAPLNEQIRGTDDPWLVWVRDRVGRGS